MLDLTNLSSITGEDHATFCALLTQFIDTTSQDLSLLEKAVITEDSPKISALTHRIRGAAMIVGANRMAAIIAKLENVHLEKNSALIRELLNKTRKAFELTAARIKRIQATLTQGDDSPNFPLS